MSDLTIIGFVLLAIGLTMIVAGLFFSNKEKNNPEHKHDIHITQQAPKSPFSDEVIHRMQHDEELKKRILEEIEKNKKKEAGY